MKEDTILVVDDDKSSCEFLAEFLRSNGFNVLTADRAEEGIGVMEDNRVDLIISDYFMPEMDGLEFLGEIKARHPGLPFILLTAFGTIEKAVDAIKFGAVDYVQKSSDLEGLLLIAKQAIRLHIWCG